MLGVVPLCVLGTATLFLAHGATGQVCAFKAMVMSWTCDAPSGQPQWGFCFEELSPVTLWSRLQPHPQAWSPFFFSHGVAPALLGHPPSVEWASSPAVAQCAGGQEAEALRGHIRSLGSQSC